MNLNKISLIAAVAALMLTGCNNDLVLQSEASDNAIEFRTVMDKTRASLINSTDELRSFYLHAGKEAESGWSFMNVAAYRSEDDLYGNGWTYAPKKYWPSYALDFFAYAPIMDINMSKPVKNGSEVTFVYDVPNDQSKSNTAVDLLVAYTPSQNFTSAVPINFEHALSSVIFSAKNKLDDLVFTIHSIEITNLFNKGTYTTNNDGSWIPRESEVNYIAGIPESGVAVNPGQGWLRLLSLNDYLMVLPQEFDGDSEAITNDVTVKVTFSAIYQDGTPVFDDEDYYDNNQAIVYFSLSKNSPINYEFIKGNRYNFQFVLGNGSGDGPGPGPNPNLFKEIYLYVTVENWIGYDNYYEIDDKGYGEGYERNGTLIPVVRIEE